ncbi:MAG TPA: OmpA family protein [Stellaceae bacterium]|nr:OmpA family protein [Stellaceae bacterium]
MKNRYLLGAGVALAMALGSAQASAQFLLLPPGPKVFYFGGEGGWTNLEDQRDRAGPFSAKETFDDGYNVGARAGLQWGPWRLEEEYNYRRNDLHSFGPFGTGVLRGSRVSHSAMTNLIYDFTFGWPVTPHIGGGIGAIDVVDSLTLRPTLIGPPILPRPTITGGSLLHGSDWEFGYQAIAGIEYNINPNVALDLDYRYLATASDATIQNKGILPVGRYKTGYSTHNFVASLIVRFGPPPPPPPTPVPPAPPAPPPPVRQVYLVFFDWDRYNITPEGYAVIRQASEHWHSGAPVQIEVTGYTDLSGSAGYNKRLSLRRANAVATALERLGVARNDMVIRGLGEQNPRVPTAQGVREPQNRRVEIVFP